MPKVTVAPIGSMTNQTSFLAQLNNALQTLASSFDDTLSRDATAPNQMETALDMNSHTVINLPFAVNNDEAVPLGQLSNLVASNVDISDITGLSLTNPRLLDFIRFDGSEWGNTRTADLPIASVSAGGPTTVDRSVAEIWRLTVTGNIALSVAHWGASGQMSRVVLVFTNPSSSSVTSWPTNTVWSGGIPPVLTPTGIDIIILTTFDGGASIYGNPVGFNYK